MPNPKPRSKFKSAWFSFDSSQKYRRQSNSGRTLNPKVKTNYVFHIAERSRFSAALAGEAYAADSLASEGFIHCSTRGQVLRTANRFYRGRTGLVLLCIKAAELGAALRFEPADGELFPHCYGEIPLASIVATVDFPCSSDGSFEFPEELSAFPE